MRPNYCSSPTLHPGTGPSEQGPGTPTPRGRSRWPHLWSHQSLKSQTHGSQWNWRKSFQNEWWGEEEQHFRKEAIWNSQSASTFLKNPAIARANFLHAAFVGNLLTPACLGTDKNIWILLINEHYDRHKCAFLCHLDPLRYKKKNSHEIFPPSFI